MKKWIYINLKTYKWEQPLSKNLKSEKWKSDEKEKKLNLAYIEQWHLFSSLLKFNMLTWFTFKTYLNTVIQLYVSMRKAIQLLPEN